MSKDGRDEMAGIKIKEQHQILTPGLLKPLPKGRTKESFRESTAVVPFAK